VKSTSKRANVKSKKNAGVAPKQAVASIAPGFSDPPNNFSSDPWRVVVLQFLGIWLLLLVLHFNALADPVYWDTILGSFHQAIWLKDNQFDHLEMCRTIPSYAMGGSKVYTNSLYPLVQAMLMAAIQNVTVFLVVNHLVELMFAAGIVTVLVALLRRRLQVLNVIFVAAVLFSFPMFHSMAATINMDLPACFFTLLAIWLYERKLLVAAVVALVVGVLIKQSVAVAILAFTIFSVIRIARLSDLKFLLLMMIPLALSFLGYFISFIEPKELAISEIQLTLSDWLLKPEVIWDRLAVLVMLVPDQTVLLGLSFLVSIIYGAVLLFNLARKCWKGPFQLSSLQAFVVEREIPLLCSAMIIGFTILYYAMNIILPRYLIWVFPVQLLLFAILLRRTPRILSTLCVLVVAFNVVNHSGYIYRLISPAPLNGFAMYLERSMEYRDDLICNQKMAKFAEEKLQECDVLTCWPFTHILADPSFGYVEKSLAVVSVNGPGLPALRVPHVSAWLKSPDRKPKPIVFISTMSNFFTPLQFDPQRHHLVQEIVHRNRRIYVFQEK
jgi:hypothetical protein